MNQYYTIGQLAKLAGISIKTLRVYEQKGLLLPERNEENRYRLYGNEAVATLEKIQLMKYLDFSLEQIAEFLQLYENVSRENMLLAQKRLLEKKRFQLNRVIAHVDRALQECKTGQQDRDEFLKSLGNIVLNQRADEVVGRLNLHADEPRGWSRFIFDQAKLKKNMKILDAGAGYGNLWRYNLERLPENLKVACVDKHNTHMDTFAEYVEEKQGENCKALEGFKFLWDDLETMELAGSYDRIFCNHVIYNIEDRLSLYRKFANVLSTKGAFICTWGGFLFYENLQPLLYQFFGDCREYDGAYEMQKDKLRQLETELTEVFATVKKQPYVLTLHFDTAEDLTDYIQQICKPVREILEVRRMEFLAFLEPLGDEEGHFSFERDTYLYWCEK